MTKIDVEELKARYDLRQYMGGRVRSNADPITIQCPFHDDSSPSCSVWPDHFYCFGCQATGDIIKYVMMTKGLNFLEACQFLDGGYTVEFSRKYNPAKIVPPKPLDPGIVTRGHARYQEGLPFFQGRGIKDDLSWQKKLGVTDYRWHYKFAEGDAVVIRHRRYMVPDLFHGQLRGISYRRDDESLNTSLMNSGHFVRIVADMEKVWGKGNVPQKKLMDAVGGPKYIQEAGTQWKLFNIESMVDLIDGEQIIRPVPILLLHAEPQQFDTLALMSLGYTSIGVPQKKEVLALLPDLTENADLVYVIGQNDKEGLTKAKKVVQAVGSKANLIFPPEQITLAGREIAIKDDGDLAKVGQLEHWLTKSVGIYP